MSAIADSTSIKTLVSNTTTITQPFVTVDKIAQVLMDALVSQFDSTADLTEYIPITRYQAEQVVMYISQQYAQRGVPGDAPASGSGKQSTSINAGTLYRIIKAMSSDDPLLQTVVDLSAPASTNSKTESWAKFQTACLNIPGAVTLAQMIAVAPANTFAFGSCLNHYLNSPLNSQLKEALWSKVSAKSTEPEAPASASASASAPSTTKSTNAWTTFQSLTKAGANYSAININPSAPHAKAKKELKDQWDALTPDQSKALLDARTMGAFEKLAGTCGFSSNWKNLLYAMISHEVLQIAAAKTGTAPAVMPELEREQTMQTFKIPTITMPS
jgi:hypothetical protein